MRNIDKHPRPLLDAVGGVCSRFTMAAVAVLMVALPIVISPWGEDAYNQIKALTMYALAGTASLAWLGTRLINGGPKWRSTIPELAVWAFLLTVLLSSVTSVNPRLSYFGAPGRYEGLLAFASYAALFFVGVHFFGSQQGMRSLAITAGVAAAMTAGYGILQMFVRPLFRGEAFIRDWYGGLGMPRVPSTLGSPVVFGGYLSVMIPLLLALAVLTVHRHRMLWTAVGSSAPVGSRMASAVDPSSGSLAQRLYIWDRTITLVRAKPWLGWGLETLGEVFPYDRPALVKLFGVRPVIMDKAHNDVLQMAVSVGVPGALAYIAFWAGVVIAAVRLVRRESGSARILAAGWLAAIAAYLIQVQFSFSAVGLAPIVWVFAGSAAGWEASRTGAE